MSEAAMAAAEVCTSELPNVNECDTTVVSEVDDVAQGSEPGASRFSMLIPTDLYDDIAKFADPTVTSAALLHGTIEQLKDSADCDSASTSSERTVADADISRKQNERLKPPQPIFARIDTPSSLSEEDVERRLSAAPAFSSKLVEDGQQITVQMQIFITFIRDAHRIMVQYHGSIIHWPVHIAVCDYFLFEFMDNSPTTILLIHQLNCIIRYRRPMALWSSNC